MDSPGPLSLLPVVLAVVLTLRTRQVVLSLLLAVLSAALLLSGGHPWQAVMYVVDPLLMDVIAARDHVQVMLFSLFIAATIQVVSRAGGTRALVELVARLARGRRSGMVTTWLAGMLVFFDDYANCLVVGTTMRPLSDRLGISRAKLAYLVDSTAAPMATVALVSTWIGFEVGLMDEALKGQGVEGSAYAFFLAGLPYRFYPLLALAFGAMIAVSGRDFGPMLASESAARPVPPPDDEAPPSPALALVAVVPVGALVGVTGWSLWRQGTTDAADSARLFEIIGGADGYVAMLEGSTAGLVLAVLLAIAARWRVAGGPVAATKESMDAVVAGMGELVEALVVLFLAWALGSAIGELGTGQWIMSAVGDAVAPWSLPAITFVLSAGIAFATGTSFGTMGMVMPLCLPLALQLDPTASALAAGPIPLATAAAVLSGATWGDHCSPISDTTVLSSTGSGCDHAEHVATQLPYALAVGLVSLLCCTLPAALGPSPWLLLGIGVVACGLILLVLGRAPAQPPARSTATPDPRPD
ncbi:MAG: Na+/H+ antiporter NhaC family protein [Alphaproteobacteria bacterium]|nr:Na+/H+ antiporter NhaC family protein [Alphaproteobacteria bacterium]